VDELLKRLHHEVPITPQDGLTDIYGVKKDEEAL